MLAINLKKLLELSQSKGAFTLINIYILPLVKITEYSQIHNQVKKNIIQYQLINKEVTKVSYLQQYSHRTGCFKLATKIIPVFDPIDIEIERSHVITAMSFRHVQIIVVSESCIVIEPYLMSAKSSYKCKPLSRQQCLKTFFSGEYLRVLCEGIMFTLNIVFSSLRFLTKFFYPFIICFNLLSSFVSWVTDERLKISITFSKMKK